MKTLGIMSAGVALVAVVALALVTATSTTSGSSTTSLREARSCFDTALGNGLTECRPPAGETWFVTFATQSANQTTSQQIRLATTGGGTDSLGRVADGTTVARYQGGAELVLTNDFYLEGLCSCSPSITSALVVSAYVETKASTVGGIASFPDPVGAPIVVGPGSGSPSIFIGSFVAAAGFVAVGWGTWYAWRRWSA